MSTTTTTVELPALLQTYVTATNAHDVPAILACFADDAVVHDEGGTHEGHPAIEAWLERTITEYRFQLKPLALEHDAGDVIVTNEVAGTFPGSPIPLRFRFTLRDRTIRALHID